MPFGLNNAPETFQCAMDIILASVKWQFALVYLDGVLVFSNSSDENIAQVCLVVTLLRDAGVALKLQK